MGHIIAAYQPRYYPQLHYLARAQRADTFVILDDVQFRRRSPQHRTQIEFHGDTWMTIPVKKEGTYVRINEAHIDMSSPWIEEHLQMLEEAYGDDASGLRSFYERLCPTVPRVTAVWNSYHHLIEEFDDERLETRLEAFRESEEALRGVSTTEEELRRERNRIDERIGQLKRDDPNADISAPAARSEEINDRLAALKRKRRDRNQRLVAAAGALAQNDVSLDSMPVEGLWKLDGVDPGDILDDVKLIDLTLPLLDELFRRFEIRTDVVRSSEIDVDHPGDASTYLAQLTNALGGSHYLSGRVGFENYLDEAPFEEHGQDVIVQDWTPSWHGGNVCALEVMFNCDDPGRHVS